MVFEVPDGNADPDAQSCPTNYYCYAHPACVHSNTNGCAGNCYPAAVLHPNGPSGC